MKLKKFLSIILLIIILSISPVSLAYEEDETADDWDYVWLDEAVQEVKNSNELTAVIANTTKGKGVSFMENNVSWHGKAPNDTELKQALEELC